MQFVSFLNKEELLNSFKIKIVSKILPDLSYNNIIGFIQKCFPFYIYHYEWDIRNTSGFVHISRELDLYSKRIVRSQRNATRTCCHKNVTPFLRRGEKILNNCTGFFTCVSDFRRFHPSKILTSSRFLSNG